MGKNLLNNDLQKDGKFNIKIKDNVNKDISNGKLVLYTSLISVKYVVWAVTSSFTIGLVRKSLNYNSK